MKIIKKYFNKVLVIKNDLFNDNRGFFSEVYNKKKFRELGIFKEFKQDNISFSKKKFTFRGIHLQKKPFGQSKLVRVVKGSIIDIVVDLRKNSKTFGKYQKILLSDNSSEMIYIPEEFGHGFLTLSNNTVINYKVSNFYSPINEVTINYKDKAINIDMNELNKTFIVSKKDSKGISLDEYKISKFKK